MLSSAAGWRKLAACTFGWGAHTCLFYTDFIFMPIFEVRFLRLGQFGAFALVVASMSVACLAIPKLGHRADCSLAASSLGDSTAGTAATSSVPRACHEQWWLGNRIRLVAFSLVVVAPAALAAAQLATDAHGAGPLGWLAVSLAVAVLTAHLVAIDSIIVGWLFTLFPPEVRYTAVALGVNAGTMCFAGPAPFLATLLARTSERTRWCAALFLSLAAALALVGTRMGEERGGVRRGLLRG